MQNWLFDRTKFNRNQRWFNRLNIAQKIGFATSLAVGISMSGTILGLFVGDYYQNQANQTLSVTSEQESLLHNIETCILKIRAHPRKLVATIEDPIWFRYEVEQFRATVETADNLLSELNAIANQSKGRASQRLKALSDGYQTTIDSYVRRFERIWPQVNPLKLPAEERAAAQMQVLTSVLEEETRQLDIQFETLAGRLEQFRKIATERQTAAKLHLEAAQNLRLQIIVASSLFSIGIAVVLSRYTGQAIARPLKAVTTTAWQVTQQSNYDLQAPVEASNEVGLLADSLNQLIRKVKQQMQQLAESKQFLEERVEERTKALQTALAQLQETQTQLIQTEKMSSLGEMVAGIAHEINNPVNFIHGNITHAEQYLRDLFELIALYQESYPAVNPKSQTRIQTKIQTKIDEIELDFIQADFQKILASMRMGTERIQEIVASLRSFSRLDEAEVKDVDLHEGLNSTLLILNSRLKHNIKVIKDYGTLPLISCHPAQLNQVFLNLLVNSIDALLNCEVEPKQIVIRTKSLGQGKIQAIFQDNGPGIPAEVQSKIFNPFFTTKPVGQGTGLGLAICYRIIEKHQGRIEVASESGKGSEFRITLPLQLQEKPVATDFLLSQG